MLSVDCAAEPALANALRRTVLGHVEGRAVGSVTIHVNTTPFWDEYLAHRMGLLVLRKGCPDTVRLDVHNDSADVRLVTAGDVTAEGNVPPAVHPSTPLVYLPAGGSVVLDGHVRAGTGSEHARFAPAHAYVDGTTLHIEAFGGAPTDVLYAAVRTLRADIQRCHGAY